MKTPSIIASVFLTLVAHEVTTTRFSGQIGDYSFRDQSGELTNVKSGLTYSEELNYENPDSYDEECVGEFPDCKNAKTSEKSHHRHGKKHHGPSSLNDLNLSENPSEYPGENPSEDGWFEDQSGQSSESLSGDWWDEEESADRSHEWRENGDSTASGSASFGWDIARKIAAVDEIISRARRGDGLLEMENPLPVKNAAVKTDKSSRHFVNFQNAKLQDMRGGYVQYLSLDAARDRVYVECSFDQLSANGTFKTNMAHTKRGRFGVSLRSVRANVTSSFNRGRAVVRPAECASALTDVSADNRGDIALIDESVDRKYRNVLEQAVSTEVYKSTHKGVMARLKAEMKGHLMSGGGYQSATKLYDMDWTEDDLSVRMPAMGAGRAWKLIRQKMDAMSYTRRGENEYRIRFDVGLEKLRWTSDLIVALGGQSARAPSVEFAVKDLMLRAIVTKSVDRGQCQDVQTHVRVKGLQYDLGDSLPAPVKSAVEKNLKHFIEHSFGVYVKNMITREVCSN